MNNRQQEYERLIAPIEDRMMRAVWRISGNPADAEDAFQDALLTVWKRWERIVRHPNPHALILHICVNAAHDVLRRRVREGRRMEDRPVPRDVADSSRPADQAAVAEEQRAEVLRAIALLPKAQARAILMHAVEGLAYRDIAGSLGCREQTVRKYVWRARNRLRTLLSHLIPTLEKEQTSHA
jgi:RNA polymerase sigma-70 factor (ECF subfamily)